MGGWVLCITFFIAHTVAFFIAKGESEWMGGGSSEMYRCIDHSLVPADMYQFQLTLFSKCTKGTNMCFKSDLFCALSMIHRSWSAVVPENTCIEFLDCF